MLAQEARQRDPVLSRQPDVQQDQVRQVALDLGAHGDAAVYRLHLVAMAGKILDQQHPNVRIIVDNEKAAAGMHRPIVRRELP